MWVHVTNAQYVENPSPDLPTKIYTKKKCSTPTPTNQLPTTLHNQPPTHSNNQIPTPTQSCTFCGKIFDRQSRLINHQNKCTPPATSTSTSTSSYKCLACHQTFTEQRSLIRHIKNTHGDGEMFKCADCNKTYTRRDNYNYHLRTCTASLNNTTPPINDNSIHTPTHIGTGNVALKRKRTKGRTMKPVKNVGRTVSIFRCLFKKTRQCNNYEKLNEAIHLDVRTTIEKHLREGHKKWYIAAKVVFRKAVDSSIITVPPIVFTSNPIHTASAIPLDISLDNVEKQLIDKIDIFITGGSGWVLDSLQELDLVLSTYDPLRASSYIELPKKFQHASKRLLNIRNNDQKCFLWCVLAHLYPVTGKHSERVSKYVDITHELDLTDCSWPMKLDDINNFEKRNKFSVNLFGLNDKCDKVVPVRISENDDSQARTIDLLYIHKTDNGHYVLIKDLCRLVRSQITRHHCTHFICRRCLRFCTTKPVLEKHIESCKRHRAQATYFPKKNDIFGRDKISFKSTEYQLPLPFHFIADFESVLKPHDTIQNDPNVSSTTVTHTHIPCGAAYKISCTDPRFYRDPVVIGPNDGDVATIFLDKIISDANELRETLKNITPMSISNEEQEQYDLDDTCHLCNKKIRDNTDKVRNHDHLTGKFLGAAHNACNLNYRMRFKTIQIPCFIHNLSNYDAHFIIAASKSKHGKITCIPNNMEKYISFSVGGVTFKDSYAFTQASLADLVENLEDDQFVNTKQYLEQSIHQARVDEDDAESNFDVDVDMDMHEDVIDLEFGEEISGDGKESLRESELSSDDSGDEVDESEVNDAYEQEIMFNVNSSDNDDNDDDDGGNDDDDDDNDDDDDSGDDDDDDHNDDNDDDDGIDPEFEGDVDEGGEDDDNYVKYHYQVESDYRNNPYERPDLSEQDQQLASDYLKLLKRKGVYMYEYMSSFDRFQETQLPSKEDFYSSLTCKGISDEDYQHALHVWATFGINTIEEYHNLYLLTDVLLLDDVLLAYRNMCLDYYGLDPWRFYTAPGLTWNAGLKMTGVTLELLTDEEQYMFVEDGMRGGISVISHRHSEANHPSIPGYDANKENKQILYVDANNLYGCGMMMFLPTGGFRWEDDEGVEKFDVSEWADDGERGCIVKIDGRIPVELHEKMKSYPLAPERMCVKEEMLSELQKDILDQLQCGEVEKGKAKKTRKVGVEEEVDGVERKDYSSTQKLILNLYDKKEYIVHYRILKLYISLGMEVTKVHKVLSFKQSTWLKTYIDFNSNKRASARNKFEEDFFKLMNNAMFGKTMENLRLRRSVDLVTDEGKRKKLISQPTFRSLRVFNEELTAIERYKASVCLNKPIYVGFCVLELSKLVMYDFYYNKLSRMFSNMRLLFTDTDSLMVEISGEENIYDIMNAHSEEFDFSNYPYEHPYYSEANKRVPGKFKDEAASRPIIEFIGLRAKCYSIRQIGKVKDNVLIGLELLFDKKTLKGIKKAVKDGVITHQDYKECLLQACIKLAEMRTFRARNHVVQTILQRKIALSFFDDKRYLLEDGITSLPYGYIHELNI